jgi:hypothetical protein
VAVLCIVYAQELKLRELFVFISLASALQKLKLQQQLAGSITKYSTVIVRGDPKPQH